MPCSGHKCHVNNVCPVGRKRPGLRLPSSLCGIMGLQSDSHARRYGQPTSRAGAEENEMKARMKTYTAYSIGVGDRVGHIFVLPVARWQAERHPPGLLRFAVG